METMNEIVARNIKRLREEKKLSMDELTRLSGVSKSMLAQIERGDGNPTISTLWKISNGMKVPFDALTLRFTHNFEIVRRDSVQPTIEDNGRFRNFCLFPDDGDRRFAIYYLEIESGSSWHSDSHLKGTTEFLSVFAGQLVLRADGQEHVVEAGESVRFKADVPHSYNNVMQETTVLHMVVYTP